MTFISVPKPLRDKLGDEASDSLVSMFEKSQEDQKFHLFTVLEDKFEHRLAVENGALRAEMHAMETGIRKDMNAGFVDLHKAITAQTKWILVAVLASVTLYPIAAKLLDRIF